MQFAVSKGRGLAFSSLSNTASYYVTYIIYILGLYFDVF